MLQTENKAKQKPPLVEHTSPIRTTSDKLASILNDRTLRDLTQLLDPYKRHPSDSPITTLTHPITVMTEHTNSYKPLTSIHNVSHNLHKQYNQHLSL